MGAALGGAVEEPHCVLVHRIESHAVNWYNVKLSAKWCNLYKLSQVVFNSVTLCTILLDTVILLLKGTVCCGVECSLATVFGLRRASVRSVKFVDRAGGGVGEGGNITATSGL